MDIYFTFIIVILQIYYYYNKFNLNVFNYQFIFIINKYNIFIKYIFIKILNFQKSIS